jgi:hypothetical protein
MKAPIGNEYMRPKKRLLSIPGDLPCSSARHCSGGRVALIIDLAPRLSRRRRRGLFILPDTKSLTRARWFSVLPHTKDLARARQAEVPGAPKTRHAAARIHPFPKAINSNLQSKVRAEPVKMETPDSASMTSLVSTPAISTCIRRKIRVVLLVRTAAPGWQSTARTS